jgi:hypothetical protein
MVFGARFSRDFARPSGLAHLGRLLFDLLGTFLKKFFDHSATVMVND